MRLTTLLDAVNQGESGHWLPTPTPDVTADRAQSDRAQSDPAEFDRTQSDRDRAQFDRLIARLIPCRTGDPELWFAEQNAQVEEAKALCRTCPFRAQCLAGALDREEPWGVWGGEVFVAGRVVATKRGRGRPRKEVLVKEAIAS